MKLLSSDTKMSALHCLPPSLCSILYISDMRYFVCESVCVCDLCHGFVTIFVFVNLNVQNKHVVYSEETLL